MDVDSIVTVWRYLEALQEVKALEADFARCAASFGATLGITRAAWIEYGVDPLVLDAAGIDTARKEVPVATRERGSCRFGPPATSRIRCP